MRPGCDSCLSNDDLHLEAVEVRRLARLLRRHAELERRSGRTAAGSGPACRRPAPRRRARACRPCNAMLGVSVTRGRLPGSSTLNGFCGGIEHERLHALREADAGAAGDDGGNPAAARCHRHEPALGVRGHDAGRARAEAGGELLELLRRRRSLRGCCACARRRAASRAGRGRDSSRPGTDRDRPGPRAGRCDRDGSSPRAPSRIPSTAVRASARLAGSTGRRSRSRGPRRRDSSPGTRCGCSSRCCSPSACRSKFSRMLSDCSSAGPCVHVSSL